MEDSDEWVEEKKDNCMKNPVKKANDPAEIVEINARPYRNADKTYDMNRWSADEAQIKPGVPFTDLTSEEMCKRVLHRGRRRTNYLKRLLPLTAGLVAFVTAWTLILVSFFQQLTDLRVDPTDGLYKRIPSWIPMVVIGSLLFMSAQLLPMIWYQWLAPQHYWKSDIFFSFWTLLFAMKWPIVAL